MPVLLYFNYIFYILCHVNDRLHAWVSTSSWPGWVLPGNCTHLQQATQRILKSICFTSRSAHAMAGNDTCRLIGTACTSKEAYAHATYLKTVLGACVARWVDQRLSTLCCFDNLSVGAASSGYDADCIVLQGKGRKGKLCQRVVSMPYTCLQTPLQAAIPGLPSSACISWLRARKASQCKSYSN